MSPKCIKIREASERTGLTEKLIYRAIVAKKITGFNLGTETKAAWWTTEEAVREYLERSKTG